MIQFLLIGAIAIIMIALLILPLAEAPLDLKLRNLRVNLIAVGIAAIPLLLIRRGYSQQAAVFVTLVTTIAMVYSVMVQGITEYNVLLFALPITLAGLVLGRAFLIVTVGLLSALVVVSAFTSSPPLTAVEATGQIVSFILVLSLQGVFLDRFGIVLREALAKANQHRDDLEAHIVDLKQAEDALRESEARYRALFKHANDAIFALREGRFVECNERVVEFFGVTKEQIVGRTPFDFSPRKQPDGRDSEEKGREFIELAQQGNPQRFEWRHARYDGTLFDAEVSLNRVELSDEVLVQAIVRDITERKQAEEAAREERQRIARDLHDAVSQTLWSANLIAEVLPGLWEQDVSKGRERLERLGQLIKGALAEMRALLLELRPGSLAQTGLDELLRNLADVTASRTQADVALRVEGERQLPHDVHDTLYRIAQEATNNIARHAAATEVEVQLRCEPDRVTLSVSDNGRGFDPTQTPTGQHLGLGIMRERADEIGATLEISSQHKRGTQITVTWSA